MSAKISALTAATSQSNADLLTIVQGGANKKTSRVTLLKVTAGEACGFDLGGFFLGFDAGGNASVQVDAGNSAYLGKSSSDGFFMNTAGELFIQTSGGEAIEINHASGAQFYIHAFGATKLTSGGNGMDLEYVPGNAGDWTSGVSDVWDAIDRLSARFIAVSGSGPIP